MCHSYFTFLNCSAINIQFSKCYDITQKSVNELSPLYCLMFWFIDGPIPGPFFIVNIMQLVSGILLCFLNSFNHVELI